MSDVPARPRISVILPVYNGEAMLERALMSVFAQTYPAHEVIVIDDGSTDGTPGVMEKYAGRILAKRIHNSGPAGGRNEGIQWVTGDVVAFLDHDDIWFKNKLALQAEVFRKYPNVGFVCCDFAVRYPHMDFKLVKHFSVLWNRKEMNFDEPLKKNPFGLLLKEHFVGTASNVAVRKEVIDRVGLFNPKYKSSQDYDYWLRCALVTDFVVQSDVLLYKKNHPSNISANVKRTQFFRRQLLSETLASQGEAIRRLGLSHVSRMSLAECDYYRGNLEFETAQVREAFGLYWRALGGYPHPANWARYGQVVSKKVARLLTFGLLSRRNLKKFLHTG